MRRALFLGAVFFALSIVRAHSSTVAAPTDGSLTLHGITLYGTVDIGLQYDTHGAAFSDYYPGGSAGVIQKNGNNSVFGSTPSNLSQSRIGLQGSEPLFGYWSGIFKLETFFNPQSGEISDGLKSLVLNNGRTLDMQNTGVDTSAAGQLFQLSYIGLSAPTFGSLTFGRQNTLFADGIAKYDPQGASQAFSLIGISGTAGGAGDTEDRRFDSSLKYVEQYRGGHLGAEYKFNNSHGSASAAYELQLGAEYAGASVDVYYADVKDAVAAATLSAGQVTTLPALGFSSSNSLSGTISDNTTYAVMATYSLGAPKLYVGYEHIRYENPSTPLASGFIDIGGYVLAYVNNASYGNDKVLQVFWAGVKYSVTSSLDLTIADYGYSQNSYAAGSNAGCSSAVSGGCRGAENVYSLAAVYRISKRFDAYAGVMHSGVSGGLANGFLNTSTTNSTMGIRFRF